MYLSCVILENSSIVFLIKLYQQLIPDRKINKEIGTLSSHKKRPSKFPSTNKSKDIVLKSIDRYKRSIKKPA